MTDSPLNMALRHFEAAEANLTKLERLAKATAAMIPADIVFAGGSLEYDRNRRNIVALASALPRIDGWKPTIEFMDLDAVAQSRLDAKELGEIEAVVGVERQIEAPVARIEEYRFRFDQKRRELTRASLDGLIDEIDELLRSLAVELEGDLPANEPVASPGFQELIERVDQIGTLLGSSAPKRSRWTDLHRHLHFGLRGDLHDIIHHDWPDVKASIRRDMYGKHEPVPIEIDDLGALVSARPRGPVATKLNWERLADEEFERLIFALISSESGYENPEWLTKTKAPDRGRDLSVYRVHNDALGGTIRHRVIIQCKHWLQTSVGPGDVALLREQMKHWEPPRIDVHIIATSGRFTTDAVAIIDRHNQSDSALRIEMWPESHLERLLASRPAMIAEFRLR